MSIQSQIANNKRNIYQWPEWMRRAAGIEHPERCALNEMADALRFIVAAYAGMPGKEA